MSRHRWQPYAAGALLAAGAGVLGGWLLPRGAVTTPEALATVVGCLAVGAAVGWLIGSRWALVVAPVAFVTAYELLRLRVDGPTLAAPSLDGLYAVLAILLGRGVDALLTLLPMLVGVGYGLILARRRDASEPRAGAMATDRATGGHRFRRMGGRVVLALGTAAVLILLAGLVRPAGTAPITDAEGAVVPGSIAELVAIEVGGHEQHLMIRGHDSGAPVLLFLEGGPGGSALGRMRRSAEPLETRFVVVTWDQRGTGKSYPALDPTQTHTVEQAVSDTVDVTDHLRQRFGQDRIYLVGSSWGSIIGVRAAQQRPDAYHAFVGTGQMVDPFETDQLMYAENLTQARDSGDTGRVARLQSMGPPPYADTLDYTEALAGNPEWMDFPHGADYDPRSEYPMAFLVEEYTLVEQLRGMAAIAETFAVLYPQLEGLDFRQDATDLEVPVYLLQGAHEAAGRATLAEAWFDLLDAPTKEWITLDHSGHTPPYDEPGRFAEIMIGTVLAETS
ncbi:MAG TPA: alpha/beta fold hydrolase [Ornithinicoccus sp.]|nr:alpha/beta fold hydrolase [Ornithinicoccus sp.]